MLTRCQHKALTFIVGYAKREGVAPTYDEIKANLGITSKSGAHRLVQGLIERGYLRSISHKARALEVLREPEVGTGALLFSDDEMKVIAYLRTHPNAMAQILEHC